ncbi:MAG: isoprenylcysteine carboxylmethyltransferase family protein [Candidatus Sericytochromatia bacterium]|nr:isoprenylcysteine carboxylmethyltransferase family protein [Candidatus Tanganyikabacteria bacterium]
MRTRFLDFLLAALWFPLALSAWVAWTDRQAPLSLPLLAVNLLIIGLFLVRRPSRDLTKRPAAWALAVAGTTLPLLMRPLGDPVLPEPFGTALQILSMVLQALTIGGILASLFVLGRSFGLVPAHRGLVTSGPYRLVRHPLYSCEMAFYVAFVLGSPSVRNVLLLGGYLALQWLRAAEEERLLTRDMRYRDYKRAVPWRFIPGLV